MRGKSIEIEGIHSPWGGGEMRVDVRNEIANILSALMDGRGGDAEMARLECLLSDDEQARAYYLRYLAVHTDLERMGGQPAPVVQPAAAVGRQWGLVILATAACALIGVGIGFHMAPAQDESPIVSMLSPLIPMERQNEIVAVVGSAQGAAWDISEQPPRPGLTLGTGMIHLERGRLRLDFQAGEQVTLEGPAEFELAGVNRLSLQSGKLLAYVTPQGSGFTVIVPNGALVDLGTKFAVSIEPGGANNVKVIEGAVMASSTNDQGHTSWEETLIAGDEFTIIKDAPLKKNAWNYKAPEPLKSTILPLSLDPGYADAVLASNPIGYWRFEAADGTGRVASETGGVSLKLHGMADIEFSGSGGFLRPWVDGEIGYALSAESFPGLNTSDGCSMELWAYSDSVDWQCLAGLELAGPRPPDLLPKSALHNPHFFQIERAGATGSNQHHVHPNFAMRSVLRSPAGYLAGVNVYSDRAYLIHEWHHIVVVRGNGRCRIYIDGELSGESVTPEVFDQERYDLIVGRLHPLPAELDSRPWSGGIDEIALYDHALKEEAIRQHFQKARRNIR